MKPLASLNANRAYGSENFKGPVQNDFCNKICQQTTRAAYGYGSGTGWIGSLTWSTWPLRCSIDIDVLLRPAWDCRGPIVGLTNTATINAAAKATDNPIAVGVRRAVKKVGVSRKKVERELGVRLSMKAAFRGDAATHFSFNYPPGSVMMFTQLHDFCGGHAGSEDWSHAKRIIVSRSEALRTICSASSFGAGEIRCDRWKGSDEVYNLFPIRHT